MIVLLTGATGFIGSRLSKALREAGVLPDEPPPPVQSCWLLLPPRLMSPLAELLLIAPQVSTMSTLRPVSVVVAVPLV